MAANVEETKAKVQRYLTGFFESIQLGKDGKFSVRSGSTRVFIGVQSLSEEATAVTISALMNGNVPPSPELYKAILLEWNNYVFGHLVLHETDDGIFVSFDYSLLGECLDPDELKNAVMSVGYTADKLDDQIKERFGGRLLYEDA